MKHPLQRYPPSHLRAFVLLFTAATAGPALALTPMSLGLDNPAVAQAYVGPATFEKLSAAMSGLRPLLDELPLVLPPGGCLLCGSSGSVSISIVGTLPSQDITIPGPSPTLLFAGVDADLGEPGAAVTLAFARLRLTGSFETGRDFVIGSSGYGPDYHPSGLSLLSSSPMQEGGSTGIPTSWQESTPETGAYTEPESGTLLLEPVLQFSADGGVSSHLLSVPPVPAVAEAGGPGWIDTNGHDLKITGNLTSWQRLYK